MKLDVIIFGQSHASPWLDAFGEGLQAHGIKPRRMVTGPVPVADLVVLWAHRQQTIIDQQIRNGLDYLVMERGYFGDRMATWTSCGFNGLNGRAQFHNEGSPPDRWQQHEGLIRPWRDQPGKYILIMGQVAGDASIQDVDINSFYENAHKKAKAVFNIPVYFRPHPLSRNKTPASDIGLMSDSLEGALSDAHLVVTYSSNTGVDAILSGVPVVAYDKGSMVWNITTHNIGPATYMPERQQWANNLAYCQWTMDEIRNGITWDHLKQRYEA